MTKLLRFTIPSAAAAVLGLATAPAQAATVNYIGCANAAFCTLPELWAGGSITVDEDGDGTIDKTFNNWMRTGVWTPPSTLLVTAFGGGPLSAGLTFTTTNGWTVTSPATQFSNSFLFDVVTPPSLALTNLKLELLRSNSTPSTVLGTFTGVTVQANTASVNNGGGVNIPPTAPPSSISVLSQSPSMINVSVAANVFGASNGTANVREFRITFGQVSRVPEPGTVVGLLAVGGLGLAMKRRQKDN